MVHAVPRLDGVARGRLPHLPGSARVVGKDPRRPGPRGEGVPRLRNL